MGQTSSLEGHQTVNYPNGDRYEGEFQKGKRHGQGVYVGAAGYRYEGGWKDDLRDGVGTFSHASANADDQSVAQTPEHSAASTPSSSSNGSPASGPVVGALKTVSGVGSAAHWSGTYLGDWSKNEKHGLGTFSYPNGDKYSGQWQHGVKHGRGVYDYANGDKFIGMFRKNNMNGFGELTFINGDRLWGLWSDDKQTGEFIYSPKNDKRMYRQRWLNGKRLEADVDEPIKPEDTSEEEEKKVQLLEENKRMTQ